MRLQSVTTILTHNRAISTTERRSRPATGDKSNLKPTLQNKTGLPKLHPDARQGVRARHAGTNVQPTYKFLRSGCFHDPETGHLPCWRRPGQGQPSWQRGVGKSRMQAPANAGAIQDLPRPAVVPATAVDRKRTCQTIREWPGRITAAEPPYPGTRSWQKRFGRPTPGDGQRFKGARSCRAETEPLTRHNATAQCRNGARLRHYMQQTAQARLFPKRSQRTNRGTPILYKF